MKRYVLAVAASAALLTVKPVQAVDYLVRCSLGSIKTCISFQVISTPSLSGGSDIQIKVRNEGARGPDGSTWGQLITGLAVLHPEEGYGEAYMLDVTREGGATEVDSCPTPTSSQCGTLGGRWQLRTNFLTGIKKFDDITWGWSTANNAEGGIKGCEPNSNANPADYYTTCATATNPDPWVVFNFHTNWEVLAEDINLGWSVQYVGDGNPANGNDGNYSIAWSTTPEPATMILLGSGLAGIAAARRRKKQNPEASA